LFAYLSFDIERRDHCLGTAR